MSVLEIANLRFSYAGNELYNNVNFRVLAKEHLGLVGLNGTGKSTLLKLIAKKLTPDFGAIHWDANKSFSYLDQHLKVDSDITVEEYFLAVYEELFQEEEKLNHLYASLGSTKEDEIAPILKKADFIANDLQNKNFYAIKPKINNILNGLGLTSLKDAKLRLLSGGEKVKAFLGKMLLEEKDVLLLDEPTNFLDAVHVEWLTKFLNAYKQEFIIVSHDFDFLNGCCNAILDLDNKQIVKYKGNMDAYLKAKSLTRKLYLKLYSRQQQEIKQLHAFVAKNIVRASTAKRAKSRRKILEKMVVLEKPQKERSFSFAFPFTRSFNLNPLETEALAIGYDSVLLKDINLKFAYGKKYVITGRNGIGKTTFLKTVLGLLAPKEGRIRLSALNDINYFAQEEEFADTTALFFVAEFYPQMQEEAIRKLFAHFGITKDLALKPLPHLSGGEQTRVRLALATLKPSNLLILDEPTNHLDKAAKQALFDAVLAYPGTVILVSHDRDFYRRLNMIEIKFQ